MALALEPAEPRGLLDQRAPLGRLARQHRLDAALRDDGTHRGAEADVRKQLDDVGAAHGRAVDQVLPLAPAVEAPRHRHLREVEPRDPAVGVVEEELDLAVLAGGAARRAGEEDVVRLLGP